MSRSVLVLILVAFAAGGAIGYVAGTSGEEVVFESDSERPVRRASEREDRGERAPPPLPENTVEDLVRAIPAPDREAGNGVITGHVRLEDGTPLADAVVRATPFDMMQGRRGRYARGGPAPDTDIEDLVRRSVERLLVEDAGRASTRSGPDGAFTLRGLSSGQHRMEAWREGYELRSAQWRSRPGQVVDFIAKPVVRVAVTVLTADGRVQDSGVQVNARMGGRQEGQWWTPEIGAVAFEPGSWTLFATAGDHQELRSNEVDVVLDEGVTPEPVTLRLSSQPGIRGRVVFPPGNAQAYCQVKALRFKAGMQPEPDRLLREGQQSYAHAGNGGNFAFHNLPEGTYLVGLILDHREVASTETVVVGGEIVEQDLEFPVPDPEDCLIVRVEGPDGKLVTGVSFRTGYRSSPYGGGTNRVTRLPDGRYQVLHFKVPIEQEKVDGRHYVQVISPRFGTKTVDYVRASTPEPTVRFEEPALLTVSVVGYAGSDYEGKIGLSVQPRSGSSSPMQHMTHMSSYGGRNPLSPDGEQKFGPIAPGEYTIYLNINEGGRSMSGAQETVTLESGANRATIAIPKLYDLTVVADGASDGTRLYLRQKSGHWSNSQRTKDGRVLFESVPAGDYLLSGRGGDYSGQMEVLVPGQSVVRFAPRPIDAYLVSITDPEGGFARAGLRDGDLIVGVDGEEFTGTTQMRALLTLARQKDACTLSVLRGRARTAVKIALKETGTSGKGAGGRIAATAR